MAEQNRMWHKTGGMAHNIGCGHWPEFGIEQFNRVPRVYERAAYCQESQGRQVFMGYPASNGCVRRIYYQYAHARSSRLASVDQDRTCDVLCQVKYFAMFQNCVMKSSY
jgi:hypothetical protein